MSAENKKLIWISVVVCAFVLVVAIAGLVFFAPKKGGEAAPASLGNLSAPKAIDPQDYLQAPPPLPPPVAEQPSDGDIIVIYGNNPADLSTPASVPTASAPAALAPLAEPTVISPTAAPAKTLTVVKPAPAAASPVAAKPAAAKPVAAKPAAAKPVAAKPAAAPAAAKKTVSEFWIQAASFTSRARADELKESLGKRGLAALITVKDISGKSWYRVRVGPYGTKPEAEGWLGKVRAIPGCEEAGVWTASTTR